MPALPARPSLDRLRQQAKEYQREHRTGLAQAQHRVAAGYGFAGWPRLVHHVQATALTGLERALVLADPTALAALPRGERAAPVGGIPPLLALLREALGTSSDVRRCAGLLLADGADPDAAIDLEDWGMSALFFAVERHDLALVRDLLAAGATADEDAFYHACEQGDVAYLDVLWRPEFGSVLNHKLDFEDEDGAQWFLDRGVDPDTHHSLHWAIGRGRGVGVLGLLLDAGADIDHEQHGARPLQVAARCGHLAAYDLLLARGASGELDTVARAVLAVARGESTALPDAPPPLPGIPGSDSGWLLGQLAGLGRTDVVRSLLDTGLAVDTRGWSHFTPLDLAAMHGHLDTAALLVERGADLADGAVDEDGSTPLDCAIWGLRNGWGRGDHRAVIRLLMDAGAPTGHAPPTGDPELDAVLAAYLDRT